MGVSVAAVRTEIQQPASCGSTLSAKYTVAILRLADPLHALLSTLTVEPASIEPPFDNNTFSYTVALPTDTDMRVAAEPAYSGATVRVKRACVNRRPAAHGAVRNSPRVSPKLLIGRCRRWRWRARTKTG